MPWVDKPLFGGNIFTHMREMYEFEHRRYRYFRSESKLFAAIVEHIWHAEECILVHKPPNHSLQCYRGTGPAVSLKDVGLFAQNFPGNGQPPTEPDHFWIKIEVDWWNKEYESEESKQYSLDVPTDLELNFTQEKFDEWVARVKKDAFERENIRLIGELVKKLPDCAERSEIMKQMDSIKGIKRS